MKYNPNILKESVSIKQYPNSEREVEVPFVLDNMPEPPARVLDVGCCDSDLVLMFNELGFDATGIDVRVGPNYGDDKYGQMFDVGDARELPYDDQSFDVVTCVSALEHFGFPENGYHSDTDQDETAQCKAMGEMLRVLKVGGILILTLPYGQYDPEAGWDKWVKFYNPERVINLFEGAYATKPIEMEAVTIKFDIRDENGWHTCTEEEAAANVSGKDVTSSVKLIARRIR